MLTYQSHISSFPVLSSTVMDMAGMLGKQKLPGTQDFSKGQKFLGIEVVNFGVSPARSQVAEMIKHSRPCGHSFLARQRHASR